MELLCKELIFKSRNSLSSHVLNPLASKFIPGVAVHVAACSHGDVVRDRLVLRHDAVPFVPGQVFHDAIVSQNERESNAEQLVKTPGGLIQQAEFSCVPSSKTKSGNDDPSMVVTSVDACCAVDPGLIPLDFSSCVPVTIITSL